MKMANIDISYALSAHSYYGVDKDMMALLTEFRDLLDIDEISHYIRRHSLDERCDDMRDVVKMALIKKYPMTTYHRWPLDYDDFVRVAYLAGMSMDRFERM